MVIADTAVPGQEPEQTTMVAGPATVDPINAPDTPPTMAGRFQPTGEELGQWAQASYFLARESNPDEYGKAEGIARRTGLPLTTVLDDMKLAKGVDESNQQDFQKLAQQFPETARFLTDERKASIVHDDIPQMSAVEKAVQVGKYIYGSDDLKNSLLGDTFGAAYWSLNEGAAGLFQGVLEATGKVADDLAGTDGKFAAGFKHGVDWFAQARKLSDEKRKEISPQSDNFWLAGAQSGLNSLGQMIGMLPLAIVAPELAAPAILSVMAATQGGRSYGNARDKDVSIGTSLLYGASDASVEYATEKIAVGKLVDMMGGKQFVKKAISYIVADVGGEQLATVGQDFNEWMVLNPEKTVGEFLRERPGAAAQTLIATLVAGGGMTVTVKAVRSAMALAQTDQDDAQRSSDMADAVDTLVQATQATKTMQRDSETMREFVDGQLAEGANSVYIDGEMLAQSDLGRVLTEADPAFADVVAEAVEIGGEVKLPIASLAAMENISELGQPLMDHFRVESEKYTRAQAQEVLAQYDEQTQKAIDQAITQVQSADAYRAQIDEVKQVISQQLDATNRFDPNANAANATLVANFFGAQAARLGVTPMELYKQYEYKVNAESTTDQSYSQVTTTDQVDTITGLPLNSDGTVTVYHHTNAAAAEQIAQTSQLNSAGEPRVYVTTRKEADTGYGDTVVAIRVDPAKLQLDDEFPDGRRDYALDTGKPGGSFSGAVGGAEAPVLNQTATLRSGKETLKRFGLDPEGRYKTREVAAALEARQRKKWGTISATDRSPEVVKKIANWMAEEVMFSMQDPDNSGVGWYSEKFQRALDTMAGEFPELATDKDARNLMTALIAITSDGQKVQGNFAQAMDVYGVWKTTGKFNTDRGHQRQASIDGNLEVIQKLYDELGPKGMHEYLMQEKTISELKKIAKANGETLKSDYQAHITMPMAAVAFGPKLGAFYANLMGAHGYLTMDRWWSRTFNRYRGTLLTAPTQVGLARFKELLNNPEMSDDEAIAATVDYRNSYEAKNFKDGTEIEKAANTIWKAAFDALEDAPFNATDRTFMLDAVNKAQQNLKRKGYNLSVADIQAILWYYEKRLYGELGARQSADISYEEAARRVVDDRARGLDVYDQDSGELSEDSGLDNSEFPGNEVYDQETLVDYPSGQYNQSADKRGAFNPSNLTTTLFKNADLSTFLHESGHFFLEMQMDMAAKLALKAESVGMENMQPGEVELIKDTATLLKFFGVRDLTEWHGMTLDEKRTHHEHFARSFEAYLYEGKSPSIELDSVFQKFRSWLSSVYQSMLKAAQGDMSNALNVQINDDVRGVMDRMLATTEQIVLAEQGRSMMPLFNSPQEAGMTQEEFAAYHLLAIDSTSQAIQDLQARSLRDMQYIHSARGREVNRLQRQAAAVRKQVRMAARASILTQPVYRAYQFLTAPLTKEDKLSAYQAPKSDPNSVDPEIDDLYTAIAKLGGLQRDQVESKWGWDTKAKSPQAGIKYVLKTNGGMTIDMMAEELASLGYIARDADGFFDQNELEEKFNDATRGEKVYSNQVLPEILNPPKTAGEMVNVSSLEAGRLEVYGLQEDGYTEEQIQLLTDRGMTAKNGLSADMVVAIQGNEFDSGDAMIQALLDVPEMNEAIEALTDKMMLEQYGELASPQAILRSADQAVFNDVRAKLVATEMAALEKAAGATQQTGVDKNGKPIKQRILPAAAKAFANKMVSRLKIRNLNPSMYANAQLRASKAAAKASRSGDIETAAAEKRNELINLYAVKAVQDAQAEIPKILEYFKQVQKPGRIPANYYDQITSLLMKFDLRKAVTNKELDNRARFVTYVTGQLAIGNIPPNMESLLTDQQMKRYEKEIQQRDEHGLLIYENEEDQAKLLASYVDESPVRSFKELTVEELRGLRDTIKQIDHIGRRTERVLTDRKNRLFNDVLAEMRGRIIEVAEDKGRKATDNITRNDLVGRAKLAWRGFFFSHIKAANLAFIMDGEEGGPMWDNLIATANQAGSREAVEVGLSTEIIEELMKPLRDGTHGRLTGKKIYFKSIDMSLNRQGVLALALNLGNASNEQRLLGGYGWTREQIQPVLDTMTTAEWTFVQGMWDHYESFRPRVGAMEEMINGVAPDWIEARPLQVVSAEGQRILLRGGYAPVIYDPRASGKAQSHADAKDAKAMMQAARVASTVQKSFTKARVEEVKGRPLMLALDPFLGSVQDTIHYLNWQPWIIDANRMISKLDEPMRNYYGAEVVKQMRSWAGDNAAGMKAPRDSAERGLAMISRNVSYVGLAYNMMSAVKQLTGITQSMAVVGSQWVLKGALRTLASPRKAYTDMLEKSEFMTKRSTSQFRELSELNAIIQDKNQVVDAVQKAGYVPMTVMQSFVDTPTWWGAYEKAIDAGVEDDKAVLLADQAVINAQGSGMQKDLSSIERQQGAVRLFTGFMSYMNTTLNANYAKVKTADFKSVGGVASFTADMALINIMPLLIAEIIAQAITPADDKEEWNFKIAGLAGDLIGFMLGQLTGFRELQNIYAAYQGKPAGKYSGASGTRPIGDFLNFIKQAGQGEMDKAAAKAAVNTASYILRLPGAQINRTIDGATALSEGKTNNPAALLFGYKDRPSR